MSTRRTPHPRPLYRRTPVATALLCAGLLGAASTYAATITVNSNLDTTGNPAICTLRDAIKAANTNAAVGGCAAGSPVPTVDNIVFNLPGSHVITIDHATLGDLPNPSSQIFIDGYSQPGAQVNTLGFVQTNAIPGVTLDGAGLAASGLRFIEGSSGSTVRGLAIGGTLAWGIGAEVAPLTIVGNFIGVAADGTTAMPNFGGGVGAGGGVASSSGQIRVGGNTPADLNLISSNGTGVSSSGHVGVTWLVSGNFIGTARDGKTALPNNTGIDVNGPDLGLEISANVISGNSGHGVRINPNHSVLISNNRIGVGSDDSAVGNSRSGVWVEDSAAPGAVLIRNNTIANNGSVGSFPGVYLQTNGAIQPTGVTLSQNRIYSNVGLGINIQPVGEASNTVTANDGGDGDAGPNNGQNFPLLNTAGWSSGNNVMVVVGTLNSTASGNFKVEFFKSPSCHASGNGEGQVYLGSTLMPTDAAGDGGFIAYVASATGGGFVTATATNLATGDTSEFSACAAVTAVPSLNNPPVANNNTYNTAHNTALVVPASGVLGNDSDLDADTLSVVNWGTPFHGVLSATSTTGGFTYTPTNGFTGADSFDYLVSDGHGGTVSATAFITVAAGANPPVANNNSYITAVNVAIATNAAGGVLANDIDPDGNTSLTALLASNPTNGTLYLAADGGFTYHPTAGYQGPDSFSYYAFDGDLASTSAAIVNITVGTAVNQPPVASPNTYTTPFNTALNVAANGVLSNDSDPDGNPITAVLATGPSHGSLTLNPNGSFVYTPTATYSGPDSFSYYANDGTVNSTSAATVSITVGTAVNQAPVAGNDTYTTPANTTLNVPMASGVLFNDSDPDGDPITVNTINAVSHGTLNLSFDGSFTYTPTMGYTGPDSFTYTVTDGNFTSAPATVTINVGTAAPAGAIANVPTLSEWALALLSMMVAGFATLVSGKKQRG